MSEAMCQECLFMNYTRFNPGNLATYPLPEQDASLFLLVGVEGDSPDQPISIDNCVVGYWDAESEEFAIALSDGFLVYSQDYFRDDDLGDYLDIYYTPIIDPRQP